MFKKISAMSRASSPLISFLPYRRRPIRFYAQMPLSHVIMQPLFSVQGPGSDADVVHNKRRFRAYMANMAHILPINPIYV